ncbi:molecular chaperone TorD family protein [Cytobacillus spongiae]|uniref:TorD/DmsD family molecular chaperone n=1 Tax=Cytobacillus spongiae TaxID=2901381 RepID=UPI001F3EE340|nr:molecular chaperone TorD family protein [Cytobacillus spongiae]UII56570.1 molecular chaperone TorD family protein [Cytobacillus spongiae]
MNQVIQTDLKEIQNLLELRVFAYDILRRTFLEEPTKELVEKFQDGVIKFFPFKEEHTLLIEGVDLVNHYFEIFDMNSNFDGLHWDYTKMFIGPYQLPAPMWGSSYVNKDGLLFQEETLRVRRFYLEYSFEPFHYGREAEDHLGLELDFMYQLSKLTNELLINDDIPQLIKILTDQRYFLREHLLNWIPMFRSNVIEHADTNFYKGMVNVLNGFLIIDQTCLDELSSKLRI